MKIGFDVDGVLADFNTAFIGRVISVVGRDLFPPRPFDISTWNYPEYYGYTKVDTGAAWENIKKDPTFWAWLPDYPETQRCLDIIWSRQRAGDDIYFVTNRMGVNAKQQTEHWLRTHRFDNPTVLLSEKKGLVAQALGLDAYIDDKYENVMDVAVSKKPALMSVPNFFNDGVTPVVGYTGEPSSTRTFLLNRPWNTGRDVGSYVTRVDSVYDFLLALDRTDSLTSLSR